MSKIDFIIAVDGGKTEINMCGSTSCLRAEISIGMEDVADIIEATNYWWDTIDMTQEQREKIIKACHYIAKENIDG